MKKTKPIPVRISHGMIERLDEAAERLHTTRAGVIKLCVTLFLEALEANDYKLLGLDTDLILKDLDNRTHRYSRCKAAPRLKVAGKRRARGGEGGDGYVV